MSPSTMPYLSLITFAKGARQFVVQEALLGRRRQPDQIGKVGTNL